MKKFTNKYVLISANMIWIAIIFILCTMPSEDLPKSEFEIPHLDKVVHFSLFFILSVLLLTTFKLHSSLTKRRSYVIIIVIVLGFGGAIEVLQQEFFNRACEFGDLVADTIGGVVAFFFFPFIKGFFKIKS